jgi:hypothetical protein
MWLDKFIRKLPQSLLSSWYLTCLLDILLLRISRSYASLNFISISFQEKKKCSNIFFPTYLMPHSQPCHPHSEQMTFLPTSPKKQRPSATTSLIFPLLHLSPCFTFWNFLWYLRLPSLSSRFYLPSKKNFLGFKK